MSADEEAVVQCTSLRSFRLHRVCVTSEGRVVLLQCERQHGHDGQHVHAFGKWRDDRAAGELIRRVRSDETEDGVFGSQDIADALGGRGPES